MEKTASNLFIVSTPYHLLASSNICKKGDILIQVGEISLSDCMKKLEKMCFGSNIIAVPSLYSYKRNILSLCLFRKNMNQIKRRLSGFVIDNIYGFNDVNPVDQWILKNIPYRKEAIIIEEGIGIYRDTVKRQKKLFNIFGKVVFGRSYEEIDRIGESSVVSRLYCTDASKLSKKQNKKNISVLQRANYSKLIDSLGIHQIEGTFWFIGQPLVEDGVMNLEEYIDGILRLQSLAKANGTNLVVKPHPRESVDKYRVDQLKQINLIEEYDIPIELLVNTDNKVYAYTYYSSAILSLAKLENCEAFCLYKLYQEKINLPVDIDKLMEDAGVQFITSFNK